MIGVHDGSFNFATAKLLFFFDISKTTTKNLNKFNF